MNNDQTNNYLNQIITRLNQMEANAKKSEELPLQSAMDPDSIVRVSLAGISYKLPLSAIISAASLDAQNNNIREFLLGVTSEEQTVNDLLDGASLTVTATEIVIITALVPTAENNYIQRQWLWKLGKGTFSPIGSEGISAKMFELQAKYPSLESVNQLIAAPDAIVFDYGVVGGSLLTAINGHIPARNYSDITKVYYIRITIDDVDYLYQFNGANGMYGDGALQMNDADIALLYSSANAGIDTGTLYDGSNLPAINPENGETEMLNGILQNIYNLALIDRIISIGIITQDEDELTIPAGAQWVINQNQYTNAAPFVTEIDPEAEGFTRVDIIVATATGFEVVQGTPDNQGTAVQPATPDDTILVSVVQIDGAVIGASSQPITGDQHITKASKGVLNVVGTGNLQRTIQTTYRITSGSEIVGITAASNEAIDGLYDGQSYFLWNDTGADITLKHLDATGEIKLHFPTEADYILPAKTIAHMAFIKADGGKLYFIGAMGGGGDGIPLSGTTAGNPVTGPIEMSEMARNFFITNPDNDFNHFISFAEGGIAIEVGSGNYLSSIFIDISGITIQSIESANNAGNSRGLKGAYDYTPNIQALDYTQKKYVDDAIAAAGGGGGAVSSVNGQTGAVVLDLDDIADGTTNKAFTATEQSKLAGIATGATANRSDAATDTLLDAKEKKLTQSSSTYASTFTVDFNQTDAVRTIALTGNLTFNAATNKAAAKEKSIILTADASSRTLSFPAWTWTSAIPTSLAANKKGVLYLYCSGTNEADVIASYAPQTN